MNRTELNTLMAELYEAKAQQNKATLRIQDAVTDLIESTCMDIGLHKPQSLKARFVRDGVILGFAPDVPILAISRDGTATQIWDRARARGYFEADQDYE